MVHSETPAARPPREKDISGACFTLVAVKLVNIPDPRAARLEAYASLLASEERLPDVAAHFHILPPLWGGSSRAARFAHGAAASRQPAARAGQRLAKER